MILTAHQPVYMPWLGLFAKIAQADTFCLLDTVQFGRKSYENRNWIKTAQGPLMLTVPVEHSDATGGEIRIVQGNWARKHIRSIELAYQNAPYFDRVMPHIREILSRPYEKLIELNVAVLMYGMMEFGIQTPIVFASDYDFQGEKSALILDMCKQLGATKYIFGKQGLGYADIPAFEQAGTEVEFQDFRHPVYPQLHGHFLENMSFVDLLMNCGPDSAKALSGELLQAA